MKGFRVAFFCFAALMDAAYGVWYAVWGLSLVTVPPFATWSLLSVTFFVAAVSMLREATDES